MSGVDYARAIPVLASLNLDESASFYSTQLGFAAERYGDYLIVRRDEISSFEVRPWDMKEFYLIDPHGNLLKFGCAPQEV
jgi:hypothetical protein